MKVLRSKWILPLWAPALLWAQQPKGATPKKPFQEQSPSTISYRVENGSEVVEVTNVAYEVTSGVTGRPPSELLMLRKSTHTKRFLDDIGIEASSTVAAWPVGTDLKQKPLYSITVAGVDPQTINS